MHVSAGVCVWHSDRMAPHLQHLPVQQPVGAERPAAVGRLALRGGRHGQLVREGGVRVISVNVIIFALTAARWVWITDTASVQPRNISQAHICQVDRHHTRPNGNTDAYTRHQ